MSTTTPNKIILNASPSTSVATENWSWHPSVDESPSTNENQLLNRSLDSITAGQRRGRPKSEAIQNLIIEGSTSPSAIKCKFCNRVFPRDKSLSAHLRTHTGERPYICDFPMCSRAFTQSGQLKTHQRLHTGEKPFACAAKNCQMRFTHANRHCPDHPYEALKRNDDDLVFNPQPEEQSIEILKWLQKYREERQQQRLEQMQSPSLSSSTSRKTPKRPSSGTSSKGNEENKRRVFGKLTVDNSGENCDVRNALSPSKAARNKGLMCVDMNAGTADPFQNSTPIHHPQIQEASSDFSSVMASPISTNKQKYCRPKIILWKEPIDSNDDDEIMNNDLKESVECNNLSGAKSTPTSSPTKRMLNPKKKWLREAWNEDLARPLDYGSNHPLFHQSDSQNWQMTSPVQTTTGECSSTTALNPNQNRPSVLIMARDKLELN